MTPLLEGSAIVMLLGLPIGLGAVIWRGFRDGDRTGDARAEASLIWIEHPDQPQLFARIQVENSGPDIVIVSVRATPLRRVESVICSPYTRRAVNAIDQIPDFELLGALPPRRAGVWLHALPLHHPRIRLAIRTDHDARRSRIETFSQPTPPRP